MKKNGEKNHKEIKHHRCSTVSDEQWCKFNLIFNKQLGNVELLWQVALKSTDFIVRQETLLYYLVSQDIRFQAPISHEKEIWNAIWNTVQLPEFCTVGCYWNQIDRTPNSLLSAMHLHTHALFHDGGVGLLHVLQSYMYAYTQETGNYQALQDSHACWDWLHC